MIAKGTTHNNGAKLADYMTRSKKGEQADLWQLRGFEATNIKNAFRDVQIMSGATKCENPFFHVQVRNREGEQLTKEQWEFTADRIERMLGLTGQPRAISFHTYEHNDDEHMHVAWSRIDQETMKARPLPFFKDRLKKISRELELHFEMEPVTNERKGAIKYAPTRAQEEQARRVGVDIQQIRECIRNCWDSSDDGRSFQAALEAEGLVIAQGDRRNLVVLDPGGGIHAIGKRILDITVAKIRDRVSDLDMNLLPSVEEGRNLISESHCQQKEVQKEDGSELEWDRDLNDRLWQEAVISAAIEADMLREKLEGAEAKITGHKAQKSRAGDTTKVASEQTRKIASPPGLGKIAGEVRLAYALTDSGPRFAQALEDRGFILARVTGQDAERLNRWEAQRIKELRALSPEKSSVGIWMAERGGVGELTPEMRESAERSYDGWTGDKDRFGLADYVSYVQKRDEERKNEARGVQPDRSKPPSKFRETELLIVDQFGQIHQLNYRNTGQSRDEVTKRLKDVDRKSLLSVASAELVAKTFQQHRREEKRQVKSEAWRHLINESRSPVLPPQQEFRSSFQQSANALTGDSRAEDLKGPAAQLWAAWCQQDSDKAIGARIGDEVASFAVPSKEKFAASLDDHGFSFAKATKEEANRSHRESAFAREIGRYAQRFTESEIVLVTEPRRERQQDGETVRPSRFVKLDQSLAEKFVTHLGIRGQLEGLEATIKQSNVRAEKRAADLADARMDYATNIKDFSRKIGKAKGPVFAAAKSAKSVGSILNSLTDGLASLFAPTLTPKQLREAENSMHRREAEAEAAMDFTKFTGEAAQLRQKQENELEADRQRDIGRGGRER